MIERASLTQKFSSASRRSVIRLGRSRTRSSGPAQRWRSTGRSVIAATIETSGIASPPIPKPRMNGSGMKSMSASPIPTAVPLKTTARPAVAIVFTTASSLETPSRCSSR